MKYPQKTTICSAIFIWCGMILAISFFESWLKFTADLVTLPIGLSIGKVIFNALNKTEWCIFAGVIFLIWRAKLPLNKGFFISIPLLFGLLSLQSFWLLPIMTERATLIIGGKQLLSSNHHIYYVATEIIKVTTLYTFGFQINNK
jgi:hypothetical protein